MTKKDIVLNQIITRCRAVKQKPASKAKGSPKRASAKKPAVKGKAKGKAKAKGCAKVEPEEENEDSQEEVVLPERARGLSVALQRLGWPGNATNS